METNSLYANFLIQCNHKFDNPYFRIFTCRRKLPGYEITNKDTAKSINDQIVVIKEKRKLLRTVPEEGIWRKIVEECCLCVTLLLRTYKYLLNLSMFLS